MKKLLFVCFGLMACLAIGQVSDLKEKGANGNLLRIELKNFSAVCTEETVNILWETSAEVDAGCFTIERSKDGINFTPIIDVPCAGVNTKDTSYVETDYKPCRGISYYRLKQTYKNGSSKYSDIVSVNFTPQKNVTVYPNPLVDANNLNIYISGYENQEVVVVLRNTQGKEFISKVLLTKECNGVFTLDEANSLLPGMYIVTASSNDKVYNYRLLVK